MQAVLVNDAPATHVLRPEVELLLCCARVRRDSGTDARIRALLQEDLDWGNLLRMAGEHAMLPLLSWHLDAADPEAVPEAILDVLRDYFRDNSVRNLFLTGELLRLLREFDAGGISAVPYKGPTLAALAYENVALRRFGDLDILVHKGDIPKARGLLASLGYRPEDQITDAQEAAFLESQREYVFVHEAHGAVVEVHWAVAPRSYVFPLDTEDLWTRLQETHLGGGTVSSFSPEDLLLILCMHGSKHFWHRLGWICDVAELVSAREHLDWEQVVERADALGSRRMLFLGLSLASGLLDAPVPETVLREVQADPKVEGLVRQVRRWLFQEADGYSRLLAKGELDESRFHPFRVRIRERWRDRIRYSLHTALVPTLEDWNALSLPGPLFPLYYAIRPIRITAKYGQRLMRQAFR